jgi:hypothetical protein
MAGVPHCRHPAFRLDKSIKRRIDGLRAAPTAFRSRIARNIAGAGHAMTQSHYERIAFVASQSPEAQEALATLVKTYGNHRPGDADVVVALGGDGLMLQTLRSTACIGAPSAS